MSDDSLLYTRLHDSGPAVSWQSLAADHVASFQMQVSAHNYAVQSCLKVLESFIYSIMPSGSYENAREDRSLTAAIKQTE
jgi:hypothetical protein